MRKGTKRASQDTIEFEHRALVEYDRVEFAGFKPGLPKTVFDRGHGKSGIVFTPGESFFLDRGDRHTIDDQCRGGVMIMC